MFKTNRSSQEKAVRLCGGGTPSLRRHREDGGSAGGDYTTNIGVVSPAPPPAPPPEAVKKPGKDDNQPGMPATVADSNSPGPKPLNSTYRRGGKTRSKS